MTKEFDFERQRKAANAGIRDLKVSQPFIFPEYQRVLLATDKLRAAQAELESALAAWDNLGKDGAKR
jgi:hypothetical protein